MKRLHGKLIGAYLFFLVLLWPHDDAESFELMLVKSFGSLLGSRVSKEIKNDSNNSNIEQKLPHGHIYKRVHLDFLLVTAAQGSSTVTTRWPLLPYVAIVCFPLFAIL